MKKPKKVNILGKEYKITYVDKPSEVDLFKRESLWGQIDYWTRTIRVYDNDRIDSDIWETIIHEILHGIASDLELKCFKGDRGHEELGIIAMALADVMFRNKWFSLGGKK